MTTIAHNTASLPREGTALGRAFQTIGKVLIALAEGNARMREFERLQAMTDAELAARNLKRENLVHHVFQSAI